MTQYSHGAGCGCKIAPDALQRILADTAISMPTERLLVGHEHNDDAAVYDLGNGRALISTTDFFSPIVDDPFDFGRVAAVNALSDVYAMGGTPLMAVAILGWPVERLGTAVAARVVEGARKACAEAGIPLAGGHSIDAPEPFFGLAVTGEVAIEHLKRNDAARPDDVLLITKPIGIGILGTAMKRGLLLPEHAGVATQWMVRSNSIGKRLGTLPEVHAMTDITGFGLLGHLAEVCAGSGVDAVIRYDQVPLIPECLPYLAQGCFADGALRNWRSVAGNVTGIKTMEPMMTLCDPQTSGGLLIACSKEKADALEGSDDEAYSTIKRIGYSVKGTGRISVEMPK